MMKKMISLLIACLLLAGVVGVTASAETASADVTVTISDNTGKLVMLQKAVTVTDRNNDGKLDIDEAFYAAHEANYEGGAAAGYASAVSTWGLGVTKLWGDTSGNYGYYVNNKGANGLEDTVKDGDIIKAFIYQDPGYADQYVYFDQETATVDQGNEITVVLTGVEYDPVTWAPVDTPLAGAVITVDGEETAYQTDAQGRVTFSVDKTGTVLISAKKAGAILVPPVLSLTVNAVEVKADPVVVAEDAAEDQADKDVKSHQTGDAVTPMAGTLLVLGLAVLVFSNKKLHEK